MSRLPRTSYGYSPPPEARARGWRCPGCHTGDEPAPRRWPHPCPECGTAVDPDLAPPWDHGAEGVRLRHVLRSDTDDLARAHAELHLWVWEYTDAGQRVDGDRAAARRGFHRVAADLGARGHLAAVAMWQAALARAAVVAHDLDGLAAEILAWHPMVDTSDVEDDNDQRTAARTFVSCCIRFLLAPESLRHPDTEAVDAAMQDIADRIFEVLPGTHGDDVRKVRQLHGGGAELQRLVGVSRSAGAVTGGLVPAVPHPDARVGRRTWLLSAADRSTARRIRLAEAATAGARAGTATVHLADTLVDLVDLVVGYRADGPLFVRLATAVADAGFVLAETQNDAASLDAAADTLAVAEHDHRNPIPSLAHLLRAYARLAAHAGGDPDEAMTELEQVSTAPDRLAPWLLPDVRAMLAWLTACRDPQDLEDAILECTEARSLLEGRPGAADVVLARLLLWRSLRPEGDHRERIADLRRAVDLVERHCRPGLSGRWQAELIRINARNALEEMTGPDRFVAQALRWMDAAEAAASSSTTDQARVALAWVAWAVGTNRPVVAAEAYDNLMTIVPRDATVRGDPGARDLVLAQAQEHTEEAGFWLARAGRYREAVVALETGRAVALGMTGDVAYGDVTAATGDGVIVYLAAAKGGGYALIVAGTYDPKWVELPRLNRADVERLRDRCLPDADSGAPTPGRLTEALRSLWENGIRDLVLLHARGRLVTLVPIGQLSLLPLHAAGDVARATDENDAWRHAANFSAIRYAPNARLLRRCQVAAAALDDADLTMLAADVPAAPGCPPLDHVVVETTAAAEPWHGRAHIEHGCTWERFRATAPGHAVWHLAGHAAGSPYAAERSAVAFADGEVTVEDLRKELPRAPRRLVVLSACETNLTGVALPNEVVGFPSTLLQLGFAGVVATSWRVNDRASAYLMARFHQLWRHEGLPPAEALWRAQQWLREATAADLVAVLPGIPLPNRSITRPFAHPWYWAAFAYTGA